MRAVTGYIKGYLNNMASASPTGSVEVLTGLPIQTGIQLGQFQEFGDDDAGKYSLQTGSFKKLFSGTYMWVQLDPAVSGTVPVGSPLYWLQTAAGFVVTTVATANTNAPDFAGVSIDPNFGAALPYAWVQVNGKTSCLFDATVAVTYGCVVNTTSGAATFAAIASGTLAVTQATVGYALSAGAVSTVQLVRITRPIVRF